MSLLLLFVVSFSPLTHKFLKWQSVVIAVRSHSCFGWMYVVRCAVYAFCCCCCCCCCFHLNRAPCDTLFACLAYIWVNPNILLYCFWLFYFFCSVVYAACWNWIYTSRKTERVSTRNSIIYGCRNCIRSNSLSIIPARARAKCLHVCFFRGNKLNIILIIVDVYLNTLRLWQWAIG